MTAKRIVQTCQLIVLLNLTHTYVLFAANLDDFKSIAKKFIPDKLADQLTAMAASNSAKYRMKTKDQMPSESSEYTEEEVKRVYKPVRVTTPKKRFAIQDHGIDFEELVDRVRQKLEEKYKNKPKHKANKEDTESDTHEQNKQKESSKTKDYDDDSVVASDTPLEKDKVSETEAKPENDGTFFKEDDLTKTKDSYEDYVTPNRDKVFESDEITKASKENTRASTTKQSSYKDKMKAPGEVHQEYDYKSDEVKAQISSILDDTGKGNTRASTTKQSSYKEKPKAAETLVEDNEYDYKSEEVKAQTSSILDDTVKGNTPKQLKGTMIPTRQFFKMSSPNYSAKLAIAEKYDFNEPLPEKDREPEDFKYFVNPPASINRKVKLTEI